MPSALLKSSQPTIMEAQDPMKNAVGVLEKKMRNLEKRKGRIEGYEKLASSGSKLNEDQKASLEQKEFLNHNLDLVKELHKQMSQLCEEYQRHQKKEQKRAKMEQKEQAHKEAAGTITKVIEVRFLLDSLTEDVRGDFLSGTNGACLLTEDNFAKLDEIYKLINPAEDEDTTKAFADKVSAACRHLQDLVESRDKPILETTYSEIYKILMQVNDCGYFSKTENEQEAVVDELAPEEGGIEFTNDVEEHVQPSTVPQDLPIADNGDHVADESLDQKQSQMNAGSPEFVPRNMQQMPAGESQTAEQSEKNDTNGGNDDEWKEQGHGQGSRQFKPRDGRGGRGSRGGNYGGRGGRGARGGRGHDTRNHNGAPREGGQQRRGGPPREGGYRGGQRDGRGGGGGYRDQNRQAQQ